MDVRFVVVCACSHQLQGRTVHIHYTRNKDGSDGQFAAPGGEDNVDNRKLFVRGFAFDMTADRLRSLFEEYGEIEDCSVITNKATGSFVHHTSLECQFYLLRNSSQICVLLL